MARRLDTERTVGIPSLIYLIKQVELAAKSHLDEIVAPHGVTALQYTALTVLARNPGMTSARLARNAFVRVQSMAQMIGVLEERGWIEREVDPESRRQLRISLTPAGWELVRAVQVPLEEFEREMLEELDDEEIEVLGSVLHRLRHRLSGSHPH